MVKITKRRDLNIVAIRLPVTDAFHAPTRERDDRASQRNALLLAAPPDLKST
jgi:hypothetical protein